MKTEIKIYLRKRGRQLLAVLFCGMLLAMNIPQAMAEEADGVALYASGISYLDATGNMQTCSGATEITTSTTTWSAG